MIDESNEINDEENEPEEKDVIELDRYDISVNLIQPNLETWVSMIDKGTVIIPPFQRDFRWNIEKSSKLIESFLFGLPVPPIFLYQDDKNNNKLLVIDGQQRLLSIYFFMKGTFPKSGIRIFNDYKPIVDFYNSVPKEDFIEFKLSCISEKWNGLTYSLLDESDVNWFAGKPLWAITVRQIMPDLKKINSMFYIFERLNTGGEPLTPMEIRKALNYDKYYKLIEGFNQSLNWRKIYGKDAENTKLHDIELILRFFALQNWEEYKEPMKEFLNNYLHNNAKMEDDGTLRDRFERTCKIIVEACGEKPFHFSWRRNLAMMDSFMVLTSKNIDKLSVDLLKDIFNKCKENVDIIETLKSRVNVKTDVLIKRFTLVSSIFQEVLGNL
jgi:uncharacterized protein with ParB-like and HNH nuclease domain